MYKNLAKVVHPDRLPKVQYDAAHLQAAGCWLAARCSLLAASSVLAARCWLLAALFWLAAGCWLLAAFQHVDLLQRGANPIVCFCREGLLQVQRRGREGDLRPRREAREMRQKAAAMRAAATHSEGEGRRGRAARREGESCPTPPSSCSDAHTHRFLDGLFVLNMFLIISRHRRGSSEVWVEGCAGQ